jgi:hypothetical protein
MEAPMRLAWYTITFLCALFSPVAFGAQTVTKLNNVDGVLLIVPVSINESRPYSFMLDTGSNRTLVRNDLLETLGISSNRSALVNMTNVIIYVHEAVAKSVAVGALSVNDLEIEGIDTSQLTKMGTSVQGVLGEDFLKHFDVVTLEIGKSAFHNQRVVSREDVTRDNLDADGVLPTSIFDRLFISHSEAYAIANPHIRKPQ